MVNLQSPKTANVCSIDKFLKSMANSHRLGLLTFLMAVNEASVSEIAQEIGVGRSKISQHLKILRSAGVVESRKSSVKRYYSISSPEAIQILKLLRYEQTPVT
jgi:DNA-binding transcriptional ArsR family regulator